MNSADQNLDSLQSPATSVWSLSFQGLLWTQFLTAINDNVFRWYVIGVGKDQFLPENLGTLVVMGSAFFIFPYILFASVAGWLADRYPKRQVIIVCKLAEILIMALGVGAVYLMGKPEPAVRVDPFFYLLLGAVFLMGTQSALFSPAKIGTIPELLDEKTIARGNGLFNLVTLTATVIGMAVGGWLSDFTLKGQEHLWAAAAVLVGTAIVGAGFSFLVHSLAAANPAVRFPVTLIGETVRDLLQLMRMKKLFPIALGVAFFWAIAGFAQLNIDFFAEESGGLVESHRTPLLVAVTFGIGLGSLLAGYLSVGRIELGLVPLGAMGIILFSLLLAFAPPDFISDSLWTIPMMIGCLFLFGLGVAAGTFDVPLEAYLQYHSPISNRGSILAATNCLGFGGILVMFAVLYGLRTPVFEGSLSQLKPTLTASHLPVPERAELEQLKQNYQAQLEEALTSGGALATVRESEAAGQVQPSPGLVAAEVPGLAIRDYASAYQQRPEFRDVLITELAYLDASIRRQQNRSISFSDYYQQWRNQQTGNGEDAVASREARLVKQATRQAGRQPLLSSRQIFFAMSLLTLPVFAFSLYRLAQPTARLIFAFLFHLLYRVRVNGAENVPAEGGAVVVSNHTSWLDGPVLLVFVPRIPRTLAWAGNFKNILLKKWADFCGVILISGGPKSIKRGLDQARQVLRDGELIGIFPEGGVSSSGQVRAFKPGLSKILDPEHPVPIIPVYLAETYGSIFSYSQGRLFWKLPDKFRRPLSVHIGEPIPQFESMFQLQQAVSKLGAEVMNQAAGKFEPLATAFIRSCKKRKFKLKIADSTQQEEKGGSLLTRSLVLRRLLRKYVLKSDETNVGILIPPSLGGAIVNLSLALDQRVAINLNYTLSAELINHCIRKAKIQHVLTSRKVMEKFDFQLDCEVVFLDDLREKVSTADKLISAFQAMVLPTGMLARSLKLDQIDPDELMTIVFTSGSTGVPKGVMLTHRNITSNVKAIEQVAKFKHDDAIVGILPFFHSMGYTATLWAPMACDIRGVYHFNPLDATVIGKLVEKYAGTFIVATPTFLRSYTKRCKPEQLKTLEVVVAGAERLPLELCDEFESKFGVRPVEGYGTTELSPITAVNIPPSRQRNKDIQSDCREGTVGRPIPYVVAKVTDLDTDQELGPNEPGMLWIKGPNVMKGYLDMPAETAKVLKDGWYKTGDVALIDNDGFIKITGRMSRFSKIGGEMVPHLKIEEVLSAFLDQTPAGEGDETLSVAVTAVPDSRKGERLIVLHTQTPHSVDQMIESLKRAGLPNIFIPTPDSFIKVEQLPILGTGKLDLKGIKDLAAKLTKTD